jgi:hypothetical protein
MILKTNDIIALIRQDGDLYGRGLENVSDAGLGKVIRDRFKVFDFAVDMDKIRAELRRKTPNKDKVLLRKAITLLLKKKGKLELANELGCTVAKIDKILEGK